MLDGFKKQKDWSKKCLDWLNYKAKEHPFKDGDTYHRIQHCYNSGEKEIREGNTRWRVDGYAEINGEKHFLEFDGCR